MGRVLEASTFLPPYLPASTSLPACPLTSPPRYPWLLQPFTCSAYIDD
jgi:hypothetical protein